MLKKSYTFLVIFFVFFLNISKSWSARINIFLNLEDLPKEEIFLFSKALILKKDQKIFPLDVKKKISSKEAFSQIYLGGGDIPEGRYTSLSLKIEKIFSKRKIYLSSPIEIEFPLNITLKKDDSRCLFVSWHVRSIFSSSNISSCFKLLFPSISLRGEEMYVSCAEANTLFIVRPDRNQVISSLSLPGTPRDMIASSQGDRLYVLTEQGKSIFIINMSYLKKEDRFFLPLVYSPLYMVPLEENQALIADPFSNYLILIDLTSGALRASLRLNSSPSKPFYFATQQQILVPAPEEQAIYVLDQNLSLVRTIHTGNPSRLWIKEDKIYVTDPVSGTISCLDINTGDLLSQIFSGVGVKYIIASDEELYVSNPQKDYIEVLSFYPLTFHKKIYLTSHPGNMVIYPQRGWLYVTLEEEKAIGVIDLTYQTLVGKITLGCKPTTLYFSP